MRDRIPTEHTRAPWPSVIQAFLVLSVLYVFCVWLMITFAPIVRSWSLPAGLRWTLSYLTIYGITTAVFVSVAAWHDRFREPLIEWNMPPFMVGVQIALIALINQISTAALVTLFFRQTNIQSDPLTDLNIFNISTRIIIAPAIEETLFRGIILHAFLKQLKPHHAIFLSSLLFTLFHQNPARMFIVFPMGLLFGWLYVRYTSIIPTFLLHAFVNVAAIALSFVRLNVSPLLPDVGSIGFVLLTLIAVLVFSFTVVWTIHLDKKLTFPIQRRPTIGSS